MSLSRNLRKAIERADFATVEDDWLARLDQDPEQIDYFILVARSLAGAGESDRARVLLELVDDQLMKANAWAVRLRLMEGARELHPDGESPHDEIIATLERIYKGQPSLSGLTDLVGLHRAVDDLQRTWDKVHRLEQLMQFELGTVVAMEGKGVGKIVEVNRELSSFKIDLDSVGEIRVGFRAAGKLLTALGKDHFLRRKLEAREEIQALTPSEQLHQLLTSFGRPLQAGEVKQAMIGLVPTKSWSSWWTAARKHRQVISDGTGTKRTYRWADTDAHAGEAVLEQFTTASLAQKLKIFKKEASREPELAQSMAATLTQLGRAKARTKPEIAFAVADALEREKVAEEDSRWSTETLVRDSSDASSWVGKIADRLVRKSALERVRERDDWSTQFRRLLDRETEPKLLDYLTSELRANAPEELEAFLDSVLAQPRRQPAAFVWAAERTGKGKGDVLADKNPVRLLQMITSVGERPEFSNYKPRLRSLVGDSACLGVLISRVDEAQAEAAHEALRRAHLEEYQREQLSTALELRYPRLREEQAVGLYAVTESIETRRVELKKLLDVEIPANRKAIEEAREMGDLRENFEYKSARQRHEYLSARVAEIEGDLRRVQPIDFSSVDSSEVRVGAKVQLSGDQGGRTVTILGPWESQPEDNIISYESELASKLLGKGPGTVVDIQGDEMTIESIEPAHG